MMKGRSGIRTAIGTAAVVAIALSFVSLRRTWDEFDAERATRAAIRGQLDAFNRKDYRAAYRFAAPEIQEQFPLPEFRRMVERGYPQIARSRSASFGRPVAHGDAVAVPVTVTGQDGVTVHVTYMMRHERGGWRVAGVDGGHPSGRPAPQEEKPEGDTSAA
jgi:Domain of unknown function (DUF4864)